MATATNGKFIIARRAVATARQSPMKNHDALRFHGWWGAEINDVAKARAGSSWEANGHLDQEPCCFFRAVFVTNARRRVYQPTSPSQLTDQRPNPVQPTNQPASNPIDDPSTRRPANLPTCPPHYLTTCQPTNQPTNQPAYQPTNQPANPPTDQPTGQPTNQRNRPTKSNSQPTNQPS